jgi:hypothetical protein
MEIGNGLLGLNRDIILRLIRGVDDSAKTRTVIFPFFPFIEKLSR